MLVRRIARPLLGSIFISSGIATLRDAQGPATVAGPWIDKTTGALPDSVTDSVPTDAETLVKVNAAVQVGGGVLLSLGKFPRLSALALAGSLVPTTVAGHDFWAKEDPQERAMHRTQFFKNAGLLGGLLLASVDTEGKPSLGWRGRRAARKAQENISSALPGGSHDSPSLPEVPPAVHAAAERAQAASGVAADKGAALVGSAIEVAKDRGPKLADAARERGAGLAEVAKDRGAELAEVAKDRGPKLAEAARERSAGLAEVAKDRGPALAEMARQRSEKWAALASDLTADQGETLSKKGRKARDKAEKKARAAVAKADKKRKEIAG
ncbi:DoxX family protein [Rhodococcus rhodnii]|uniref:DoxX family protein n=2 Tax=Rhodococcus rhodnii TaxID=38312 RepID=R7WTA5_9NOCA|nr:DoxX family protein [Rhodococcus rhodnii]EOM78510.1 hypothetical protein Rrhod_0047 [Rhodococcus rhodnii LMG 5362]TXG91304.1 DoxX family protein [Rhodococcus rhodnii]